MKNVFDKKKKKCLCTFNCESRNANTFNIFKGMYLCKLIYTYT